MDLNRIRKLAGLNESFFEKSKKDEEFDDKSALSNDELENKEDLDQDQDLSRDDDSSDFDHFNKGIEGLNGEFSDENGDENISVFKLGTLGFKYNFEDNHLEIYDENNNVIDTQVLNPEEALKFIEDVKTREAEYDDQDQDDMENPEGDDSGEMGMDDNIDQEPEDMEHDQDQDQKMGAEEVNNSSDELGESEELSPEELAKEIIDSDETPIEFKTDNKKLFSFLSEKKTLTNFKTNEPDLLVYNQKKNDTDTLSPEVKKTPTDVSNAINKRIKELEDSIEQYDHKGYNDNSVKSTALDALKLFKTHLSKGDVGSFKEAQVLYGRYSNPITYFFPTKMVDYLHDLKTEKS